MYTRIYFVAAVLAIVPLGLSAANDRTVTMLIAKAEGDVGDLTSPLSLWRSRSFVEVAAQSGVLQQQALALISSQDVSLQQKLIVVYGLQTLPKADYVKFFRDAVRAYRDGKCPDEVMAQIIDPGFEWGQTVVANYKSRLVAQGLRDVIASAKGNGGLKELTESVQSGKRYQRLLVYMADESSRGADDDDALKLWTEVREGTNKP